MKIRILCFYILFSSSLAIALDPVKSTGNSANLYIENDSRSLGGPGSDQAYSNGFRISYVMSEEIQPALFKLLTNWSDYLKKELTKSKTNYGVSLAHQIFSPNNIIEENLNVNDRPYAGWLNLGFSVHFKNKNHDHLLSLNLGMIGSNAMGEEVQNNFHRLIDTPEGKGWKNQLHSELTLQLYYQQRLRFFELFSKSNKFFEIIPYYGAGFGNVAIESHVGGIIRYGINLPDDFGPTRDSANEGDTMVTANQRIDNKTSLYVFSGVRGIASLRNIFLDGNTFEESHRVHKYPFLFETDFGFGTKIQRIDFIWRFVTRSPEFKEQSHFNSFASISFSYLF